MIDPLKFDGKKLKVLDQRKFPGEIDFLKINGVKDCYKAIKKMVVRGAPLIGSAAFCSLAIEFSKRKDFTFNDVEKEAIYLMKARPTAVNLKYAVEHFKKIAKEILKEKDFKEKILKEAKNYIEKEIDNTKKISTHGLSIFKKSSNVLTYCNAGSLATMGEGTAIGVIKSGFKNGFVKKVYVCETRPFLQGMRLTTYELKEEKIPFEVICDNSVSYLMDKGLIDLVIVGADRIARNGDVANKIGTFSLAISAKYFKIPFYVAAPLSSFDFDIESGKEIVIEERNGRELYDMLDKSYINKAYDALYYAFDITPFKLITGIITEKGIIKKASEIDFA